MAAGGLLKSRLLWIALGIALGIGTLVGVQLLNSRTAVWAQAQASNSNLVATVSHVFESALQTADRSIGYSAAMAGYLERLAREDGADDRAAHESLRRAAKEIFFPSMSDERYGIQLILDHTGKVLAASQSRPAALQDFSHRHYFRVHEHNSDVGFYISPPFISDYDKQPSVAMSRRWDRHDGSFGGVVVQTLKLSVLQGLFTSFELGPDSGISLFLRDGNVLAAYPQDIRPASASADGSTWFEIFQQAGQGSYTGVAGLKPVDGLHVFRALGNYPVIVAVTQASHSILGPWSRNAYWLSLATLVLMASCIVLAILAERRMAAQRVAVARLGRAQQELHTIVENLPVLVSYWDDKLINRMANVAHLKWTGMGPDEMLGRHISECVSAEHLPALEARMHAALAGAPQLFEWEALDFQGKLRQAIVSHIPDKQNGIVKGFFATVTDITDRRAMEVALLDEKERFRVILESINDGVITTDCHGCVLYMNPAAETMIGRSLNDVRGTRIEHVMRVEELQGGAPGTFGASVLRHVLETERALEERVEQVLIDSRGERKAIETWAAPILDEQGKMRAAVKVFHGVGQARERANKMAHLAQHDALTGLPNRRMLDQVGQGSLARAASGGRQLAILYLDLDGFKQVNDEHGHAVGDELLVAITRRLSRQLREGDGLYRQGGDEFVVLGDSVRSHQEAVELSRRLIGCCQTPVRCSSGRFSVTLSIGISMFPDDGTELGELVQRADRGMYAAKNAGRNTYARVGADLVTD